MASYTINKFKYNNNIYNFQDAGALQLTSESGQTVSGPVSFEDSVSIDDVTAGNLVVTGSASFTNNLQANTINGVTVGNSPKFTDTITTVGTTGSGNAITAISATNGVITATKGTTFLTSHQDISGKADKSATVSTVTYDSTNAKITKTINGTTSDVVTVATLKTALGSMPASDVYSWAKASTKPSYTASEVGAATSGHTHTASLAEDTGTSAITLASAKKYKLTAGGSSIIFTMPTIPTVSYPVTSVNSKTGAVSLTASDVGAAASSHAHGNITSGGDITATAPTIASGDQLIINDDSTSKITNGPTFDGSTTTTALTPKGTWETFSKFSGSYNDLTNKPTIPTNTDEKLKVAEVTSATQYYPIVGTGTTAATRQYDTTGLKYKGTTGTTSAAGTALLELGNSTASGTAGNKQGKIIIYGSTAYAHTIEGAPTAARTLTLPNASGTIALTSNIPSVPTSAANHTTGISIAAHGTTSIGSASGWSAGSASSWVFEEISIPNVTSAGSASTWAFEDVTVPIRNDSATSIPNVTSVGSASTWSFTDVTVPIRADSATTVPIAGSAVTVPIKNTSATSIPNVTAVGSGSFTSGSFSGGSGSFSATVTNHVLSFSHTHTAATHGADSHTHTAPTLGTAISIYGVQSSTTSVTGVSGSTSVYGVKSGTGSTTTASKASGANGTAPTLGTAISIYGVKSGTSSTVTASHVKSGGNGTAPTLGTAIKVQSKKSGSNGTAPSLTVTSTTVTTGTAHTITDNGHTHTLS